VEKHKFKVDIDKYLVLSKHRLDVYDFRMQDFETIEDIEHHIRLCNELSYFEKKKLDKLNFKFNKSFLESTQVYNYKSKFNFFRAKTIDPLIYLTFIKKPKKTKEHFTSKSGYLSTYETLSNYYEPSLNMVDNRGCYCNWYYLAIPFLEKIKDIYGQYSCKNLLDYGCGNGALLILLNRVYGLENISGFEYFGSRYASAWMNFSLSNVKLNNFFLADGSKLPLKNNSMDLIYTCHVLEQMDYVKEKAIDEIIRVAKKIIILREPSLEFSPVSERIPLKYSGYPLHIEKIIEAREDVRIIERYRYKRKSIINPSNVYIIEKN
jgi:ubiquinone/menaquinone biosynthesis C-methylase UbiE